ncbi:GNAT family N-acetyltransferase [Marinibacterium profundimaris]|uniref:BioF2-like acetyltransferase domain-containing protein n=1 Tax=Marinibacterium profundimaris TaxID=1679460 RepID=A0A225NC22_9RHOB|nr:GNAT family N-acetyltransferase [Marinibacterium profundimaris]MAU94940.1 GNAT family N-acetyltransferase [Fulvimarina sp.]OWU68406.1 hypothetical protein ATO3_24290 [Marinibacterium profundimaris]
MSAVTILTLSEPEAWTAAVEAHGLPSHTHGYARGLAAAGLDPRLAVVEAGGARMLLPFVERPIPGSGLSDIATIPGLSGAAIVPDSLAPLQAWAAYAADRGWVTGYIQLGLDNHGLQALDPDHIRAHNIMIRFDLSTWDLATSTSRNARRTITKPDRQGVGFVTGRARLEQPFLDLYYPAMARLKASSVFPRACIETWYETDGLDLFGAEVEGGIVAAYLTHRHGDHVDGHLAATTEAGRSLGAWMFWRMAEHYRAMGVRYFNIGGAGTPGDGIHWTKGRFNADEFPLLSVRQVYDRGAHDRLCAAAGDRLNPDRFPPYRV